jgi:hypothetical protein
MTKGIWLFLAFTASFALLAGFALAEPSGANYTDEVTTQTPASDPESHEAYAGNVTYMTMDAEVATMSWQGYYGNVSGVIQLANGDGDVFYNWSVASPTGEVYASENGSGIAWGSIDCFDMANNITLENWFNISDDDVDGVSETFSEDNTHVAFYTGSEDFTAGECAAAYMYDETGTGSSGTFEEVLLTDGTDTVQVIFTSLLESQDEQGFDDEYYDFEMLVLEDGHGTEATSATTYYFYVELDA